MKTSPSSRCPTCHRRYTRSSEQNRRYWALLFVMAERLSWHGTHYSADQWHHYCKARFLGCEDMALPGGRTLTLPHSTADLDTAAFNEYMERVEAFAAERDCYLADMEGAA
jgi:hypothetical protein